jgi:hypothetical protein
LLGIRAAGWCHAEVEIGNDCGVTVPLVKQCPTCIWRLTKQEMLGQHKCKTAISVSNDPDKVEWIGTEWVVNEEVGAASNLLLTLWQLGTP